MMCTTVLRRLRLCSFQRVFLLTENAQVRTFKSSSGTQQGSRLKKLLAVTAVGAGVGAFYAFNQSAPKPVILNKEESNVKIVNLPDVQVSRHVKYPNDTSGLDLVLFQYPTCPFCCKVRAFLDYHGLSYKVVEVNPVMRQQVKWTDYKKVPIVLIKTEDGYIQLNDSSMIISTLATYLGSEEASDLKDIAKCYPSMSFADDDGSVKSEVLNRYFLMNDRTQHDDQTRVLLAEQRKWRRWADDVLVHVLSPNVYRSTSEAIDAFKWFSSVGNWEQHFSSLERQIVIYVGAMAMWLIGKKLKNKYRLKDDVRESLYDECNVWVRLIRKKGSQFHGGDRPDLADLAVYGVLSSIEGCSAFGDVLARTSLGDWFFSMKKEVSEQSGALAYNRERYHDLRL